MAASTAVVCLVHKIHCCSKNHLVFWYLVDIANNGKSVCRNMTETNHSRNLLAYI